MIWAHQTEHLNDNYIQYSTDTLYTVQCTVYCTYIHRFLSFTIEAESLLESTYRTYKQNEEKQKLSILDPMKPTEVIFIYFYLQTRIYTVYSCTDENE